MKQILQNYKTGDIQMVEIPVPADLSGSVLVKNAVSLVSIGTERYMIDLAKKSLLGKAVSRPDLVKQVISKVHVLQNWVDTDELKPLPGDNTFSKEHHLNGRFIVGYAGTHKGRIL